MVVHPRLVGVLLRGRSAWKALAETEYFVLQQHPRQTTNALRIITRGFPHYRVAEGDSVALLQQELEFLSRMARVSIQGKVTSKKISTWLKSTFELNSILAINQQGHLLHSEVHQDTLDHDHLHHDADGYLSDSSSLSNEELTDHDRRPLRRAISLEDLSSAAAIHRQLHTSGLLQASRLRPRQRSHQGQHSSTTTSHRYVTSFAEPITRPASSASIYHRHQRSTEGGSDMDVSYVPLKDRPHSAMSLRNDHSKRLSSYTLQEEHAANSSLPTPDASPEELSDSSDELVIIQGELLEEARATRSAERLRAQIRQNTLPGAVVDTHPETEAEARMSGDISLHGELESGSWNWLTDAPFIDALVNWIEGPEHPPQQKSQEKDKPNPWLDIPFQFIALLTYPEPDPKSGNKPSLAVVRETAFVRQRRRTLLMLTAYTLLVRYCSFDFFVVVLFASNCAMLFLMKNSGRMNVNMAKRAVRQRVGWAKQWAGGIFKRGGNSNSGNPAVASASSHQHQYSGHSTTGSAASNSRQLYGGSQAATTAESIRNSQPSPAPGDSGAQASAETSPQMKRRGLFGKRVAVTTGSHSAPNLGNSSAPASAASTPAITSHGSSSSSTTHGDGASIMTGTTQKKRFFRRNNNGNQSANNTSTTPAPMAAPASAPIPIPSRTSISSSSSAVRTHQHHASTSSIGTPSLAARSTVIHTQLSSSPLAKAHPLSSSSSQSPSQPQFSSFRSGSPVGGGTTEREGRVSPNARALAAPVSSSPALKPQDGSVQTTTAESSTLSLSTKNISFRSDADDIVLISPTPIHVPFSTPHLTSSPMTSGLSQLLQSRTSLDNNNNNNNNNNITNNNGTVQQDKSDQDTKALYSSVPEASRDHAKEGHEPQCGVSGQEKDAQHESMLDAVTSAAADAMEGV